MLVAALAVTKTQVLAIWAVSMGGTPRRQASYRYRFRFPVPFRHPFKDPAAGFLAPTLCYFFASLISVHFGVPYYLIHSSGTGKCRSLARSHCITVNEAVICACFNASFLGLLATLYFQLRYRNTKISLGI